MERQCLLQLPYLADLTIAFSCKVWSNLDRYLMYEMSYQNTHVQTLLAFDANWNKFKAHVSLFLFTNFVLQRPSLSP